MRKPLRYLLDAGDLSLDALELPDRPGIQLVPLHEKKLGVAENGAEGVVDRMVQSDRDLREGGEPLRLEQLSLKPLHRAAGRTRRRGRPSSGPAGRRSGETTSRTGISRAVLRPELRDESVRGELPAPAQDAA